MEKAHLADLGVEAPDAQEPCARCALPGRLHPAVLFAGIGGLEVGKVVSSGGRASAFIIGRRLLVTCRHVLHPGLAALPNERCDCGRIVEADVLGRREFLRVRGTVVRTNIDTVVVELEKRSRARVRKVTPARITQRREQPLFAIFGFGNDENGSWAYAASKQDALQWTPQEIARGVAMDTHTISPVDGVRSPRWGDSGAPVFRRWGPFFRLAGVLQYVLGAPTNEAGFIPLAEILPDRLGPLARRILYFIALLTALATTSFYALATRETELLVHTKQRGLLSLVDGMLPADATRVSVGSAASKLCGTRRLASKNELSRLSKIKPCVWLEESPNEDLETFARDGAVLTYMIGDDSPRCAVVCGEVRRQ